jgi:hypothetical protein
MFERLKKAFDALIGKEGHCQGDCSCHDGEGIDAQGIVGVELDKLSPDEQELLRSIMQPIGQQEDEDECDCEEAPPECGDPTDQNNPCIHMQVKFTCLCHDGDAKPTNCSANTCPARAQMEMLRDIAEREGLRFYN